MDASSLYRLYQNHPTVTTDSRHCPPGSIFIALRGASFDGNRYAQAALDAGCACAVVDEAEYCRAGDDRYILVPDCLTAYKELAREHRRRFHIPVVGITGTNGKTTTKELLSAVLARRYRVMYTEANYNNDVGVPLTLLRLAPDHEIAVVEMGASHPGDIQRLVDYVEPTCGLVTNVGCAHLEGFGSFEGVCRTKGELYDHLVAHGCPAFLDVSNPHLTRMAAERGLTDVCTYSADPAATAGVTGRVVSAAPYVCFAWCSGAGGEHTVQTQLIGTYNLSNLLAAVAVGLHFGVEPGEIDGALAGYAPRLGRSQLVETRRNRLIVDAYNANLTSMHAALDNFAYIDAPHKMVILGDMRELGDASASAHAEIVAQLRQMRLDEVWLVGPEFGRTEAPFRKFADARQVRQALQAEQPAGCLVLVKGSNGIHLSTVVEDL